MNNVKRRDFLKQLSKAGACVGSLGFSGLPAISFGSSSCGNVNTSNGVLVVVFQRGANDGMNMLAPNTFHKDTNAYSYYAGKRKVIAHAVTTVNNPAYRVTYDFGKETGYSIHPAMSHIKPLIDSGKVSFFPGTHVGHSAQSATNKMVGNMSHFKAQDIMELGGYGRDLKKLYEQLNSSSASRSEQGWVARSYDLDAISKPVDGEVFLKVFGFRSDFSLIGLQGEGFIVSSDPSQQVGNIYAGGGSGNVNLYNGYDSYYESRIKKRNETHDSDNDLSNQWKSMQQQFFKTVGAMSGLSYPDKSQAEGLGYKIITLDRDLGGSKEDKVSEMGNYFSKAAVLIKNFPELELITINQGDYDTHSGQLDRQEALLDDLAQNLKAFHDDVTTGPNIAGRPVEVLVITEFGRTFDDSPNNPSGGTDHGQAFTAVSMSCGTSSGVTAPVQYGRRLNYSLETPPFFENDLIFKSGARYYTRAVQDYRDIIREIMITRQITCRNPFADVDPTYTDAFLPGFLKDTAV